MFVGLTDLKSNRTFLNLGFLLVFLFLRPEFARRMALFITHTTKFGEPRERPPLRGAVLKKFKELFREFGTPIQEQPFSLLTEAERARAVDAFILHTYAQRMERHALPSIASAHQVKVKKAHVGARTTGSTVRRHNAQVDHFAEVELEQPSVVDWGEFDQTPIIRARRVSAPSRSRLNLLSDEPRVVAGGQRYSRLHLGSSSFERSSAMKASNRPPPHPIL